MPEADQADIVDFDPRADDFMRRPQDAYRRLRAVGSVWQEPETGIWYVTSYDLAEKVMRDHEGFSSAVDRIAMRKGGLPAEAVELRKKAPPRVLTMTQNDAPDHGIYRKLVSGFFMPRGLRTIEPFVRNRIDELLDAIDANDGTVDFFPAFAVPLPVSVIGEYLGMRRYGDDAIKRWSDAFADELGFLTSDERAIEIARLTLEAQEAMLAQCKEQCGQDGSDIITHLANAKLPDGRPLTEGELTSIITQLMVAGNETTTATLGFAVLRLASESQLAERLREEPELISNFIEEVLRLDSPIQGQFRRANRDHELGGECINKGDLLHVRLASANRDESIWGVDNDQPNLDGKPPKQHLAFGMGIHFCVGAALSRLELKLSLEALLARYSSITLKADPERLPFRTHFHQRGMVSLPIDLKP